MSMLHKTINRTYTFVILFVSLAFLIFPRTHHAGGFATDVPSAAAGGNSYSGQLTGRHNISNMFANPATMMLFSGDQINFDASTILPVLKISEAATARTHPRLGDENIDLIGDGSLGVRGDKNVLVPMVYGMKTLREDLKIGLSLNVPWGLSTQYADDWIGRYHALDTELKSLSINPIIAYQINSQLTIAGGLQIQKIDATLTTAIDFGSLLTGRPNLALDGYSHVSGDDWGYGYKFGLLYALNNKTQIGIAYRSKVDHTLQGTHDFTVPDAAAAITADGQFVDTGIQADLTTPETLGMGISYQINEHLEWMLDAAWTRWSQLDTLTISHDNPLQADIVTRYDWKNHWFFGTGLNHQWRPNTLLRFGFAYEPTAVNEELLSPRVPVEDKYLISFGIHHQVSKQFSFDVSYVHEFFDEATSQLNFDDPNNLTRGSLDAQYDLSLDILAASITYKL